MLVRLRLWLLTRSAENWINILATFFAFVLLGILFFSKRRRLAPRSPEKLTLSTKARSIRGNWPLFIVVAGVYTFLVAHVAANEGFDVEGWEIPVVLAGLFTLGWLVLRYGDRPARRD